jgi:predicted nuclease with RNAse H fold
LLRQERFRRRYGVPDRRGMRGAVYANYRVCDYELIRRGLPLYQVAASYDAAAGWMRVGFDLARALQGHGYHLPRDAQDRDATLLEVFPDAAFVTLLGSRPPKKSLPAGAAMRRALLHASGIAAAVSWSHDDLDAVAAALTAHHWAGGLGCAVGDPEEGLIVLPVQCTALLDRYRPCPIDVKESL